MTYVVDALTSADARAIVQWRYPQPYDLYNMQDDADAAVTSMLLTARYQYYAVRMADGRLAGFCCYGAEGRVPGWSYQDNALDVGVGMHPALTGQGRSTAFLDAVITYGMQHWPYRKVRATIAAFNVRSQRAFQRLGLREVGRFYRPGSPALLFIVMESLVDA